MVHVYIEIEKGSNLKYEYSHETKRLELDRVLPEPYVYPFAYGFIPDTRADDGDEIDVMVITDQDLRGGDMIECEIIAALEMEDEKGDDIKLIAIPSGTDVELTNEIMETIRWFFSNYKSREKDRWSRTGSFLGPYAAQSEYEKSIVR